jgi:hypothetical protein
MESKPIDVFISRKSQDAKYAKPLYDYLIQKGLHVFESDHTLKEMGDAEYIKSIDYALSNTHHMIVLASSQANINAPWVEAEWLFFLNRKRSGKASGNIVTVTKGMPMDDVPPSLQNYEIIEYHPKNFDKIYAYVRKELAPIAGGKAGTRIRVPWYWHYALLIAIIISILFGGSILAYYQYIQPFSSTIHLQKSKDTIVSNLYPHFEGGKGLVSIGNEEKPIQFFGEDENGFIKEDILENIPASFKNVKTAIRLQTKSSHWKLKQDSIILSSNMYLELIPDGSLSEIRVKLEDFSTQEPIREAIILVNNDTSLRFNTDLNGIGHISIPNSKQQKEYKLSISKAGYITPPLQPYYAGLEDKTSIIPLEKQ